MDDVNNSRAEKTFKITIVSNCVPADFSYGPIDNQVMQVGDQYLAIDAIISHSPCQNDYEMTQIVYLKNDSSSWRTLLPAFIEFDPVSQVIFVDTPTSAEIGSYAIWLEATLNDVYDTKAETFFTLTIEAERTEPDEPEQPDNGNNNGTGPRPGPNDPTDTDTEPERPDREEPETQEPKQPQSDETEDSEEEIETPDMPVWLAQLEDQEVTVGNGLLYRVGLVK